MFLNVPFTNTTSKKSLKVSLCRSVFKAYFSFLFFRALHTNVKRKWKFYLPRKKKYSRISHQQQNHRPWFISALNDVMYVVCLLYAEFVHTYKKYKTMHNFQYWHCYIAYWDSQYFISWPFRMTETPDIWIWKINIKGISLPVTIPSFAWPLKTC